MEHAHTPPENTKTCMHTCINDLQCSYEIQEILEYVTTKGNLEVIMLRKISQLKCCNGYISLFMEVSEYSKPQDKMLGW